MKRLLLVLGVVLAAAAIAAVVLLGGLDSLVRDTIERVGSDATQARVTVGAVEFRWADASGTIAGLTVANPAGYDTPQAFAFDEIRVHVRPQELKNTPVVIDSVEVSGCEVTYEWKLAGSNVAQLEENVRAYAATGGATRGGAAPATPGDDGEPRLLIRELVIAGGNIHVAATGLGDRTVTLPLDRVVLTDVGANSGGATAADITEAVISALARQVGRTVQAAGIDALRGVGERLLDGVLGK